MVAEPLAIDADYLHGLLGQLVAIDSSVPNEGPLAAFVADELRTLGLAPELHEVEPGRPNVYATATFGSGGPFLVFSGHSDTVPPGEGWEQDPFELVRRDGHYHGLGVVNMKGGLACQLAALRAVLATGGLGLRGRLGFAMTVDQEAYSVGARALLATHYGQCDAMLHGEHFHGSSETDYLPSGVTGKVLYRLRVHGRAAHGFRPHLGVNAVDDAAGIVTALDRLRLREHPDFGRGTVCALKIDGGYRHYAMVVPAFCEIIVNRLLVPGESRETALADMRELVDSLGLRSSVEIDFPPPSFEPYRLDPAAAILPPFVAAYTDVTGRAPHFAPHRGVVDANVFDGEGGIPTVVFGPKGGDHHSPQEHVEVDSLEPTARVYAETARRYLADG